MKKMSEEQAKRVACEVLLKAFGFAPAPTHIRIRKIDDRMAVIFRIVFDVIGSPIEYEYCFGYLHFAIEGEAVVHIPVGRFKEADFDD